jgi:hypothetical protein
VNRSRTGPMRRTLATPRSRTSGSVEETPVNLLGEPK